MSFLIVPELSPIDEFNSEGPGVLLRAEKWGKELSGWKSTCVSSLWGQMACPDQGRDTGGNGLAEQAGHGALSVW